MKKIYRMCLHKIERLPVVLEALKNYVFEYISIYKKRSLYKNIVWTKEQKKQFNDFWINNYGKKIPDKWHKLYQSINGTFRPDYFPDVLYTSRLENKLNSYSQMKVFSDKSMLDIFFNGRVSNVRTPHTYISSSKGLFYDENRNIISRDKALKIIESLKDAVIKPTVDTSSGENVRLLSFDGKVEKKTGQSASELIDEYKTDFIIQEKIIPNKLLSDLYPDAVNTFRIITYYCQGQINVAPISVRIGSGGGVVDNIHSGGMGVGVDEHGCCKKRAFSLGNCDNKTIYTSHPDTGIVFEGYKLPFVNEMSDAAKKLHLNTNEIGIISWDMTVNDSDEIIIIEANTKGQGVWLPQIVCEEGLFGNNIKNILEFIK